MVRVAVPFIIVLAGCIERDTQRRFRVIVELGHNDNGPYDSIRARASIPGIGYDSLKVTIKETGVKKAVYTYGEYMRRFIRETRGERSSSYPLFSNSP